MKPPKSLSAQTKQVLTCLKRMYPDAHCALNYRNPFELLVATMLSSQCTDVRVNQVTATLFETYPDPQAFASAEPSALEQAVRPTGFFRNKAAAIQASSRILLAQHGGEVPRTLEYLTQLPGVGRKTASVVMGNAFGAADGVVVDTHVSRLSQRLGLSSQTTPEKIEQDLMVLIPKADWVLFPHLMIAHGRAICKARKPDCGHCLLNDICPSAMG
ncbi:MAG: endonuclease III [Candidatus Melainabacteria bacterium HGW-Melainabacteria-1]|nr:MAG: endonuclease III [Candidatus Melainabacteria bacterium HGW-Melainabacteria-1]